MKKSETVHYKAGQGPEVPPSEPGAITIRGFARGCLVDPDGTEHYGDWHQNAITTAGVAEIIYCFAAVTSSSAASYGQGTFMGVGNHTSAIASTAAVLQTEYGALTASSTRRQTVAVATAAYGTVSFTQAYASSDIPDASVVNAVGIFGNSSAGTGPAYSIATFASSSKASTQALNVTYVWNFAT